MALQDMTSAEDLISFLDAWNRGTSHFLYIVNCDRRMPSVFQYLSQPSWKGGRSWPSTYVFSPEIEGCSRFSSRDVRQMLERRLAAHADSGFPVDTLARQNKARHSFLATLSVVNGSELADEDKAWLENTRSFERNGYGGRRSTIGSRKMPTLFLS